MSMYSDDNYLKKELYDLIKNDDDIFEFIQDSSLDGMWYWDLENPENEWMNQKFWTVLGYDPGEMPHKASAWQNIINKDDLQIALDNLYKHLDDPNHPYDQNVRYTHKNGSTVWIRCRGMAIRNQKGRPSRMLGAHQNITDLKEVEIRIKEAQEIAQMGNWELDLFRNELIWSEQVYHIFNCDPNEFRASYEAFLEFVHPDDREIVDDAYTRSLQTKTPYEIEHRIITNSNTIKYVKEKCHTDFDEEGNPIRSRGIVIDITDQKNVELELRKAKEKAEESDRLKSAFLANMSHEIRTPMNGILGFANLLKEPGLSGEEQSRFISIIEKSGLRMLKTINDIIDISKIESGQVKVSVSVINVEDRLQEIFDFFLPEAMQKNIQLSITANNCLQNTTIQTDKEKFLSILTNLIKNAIKFTDIGGVEYGYTLIGKKPQKTIQFYVKDTGVGIPKEKEKEIFERFVQADFENTRAYEGSGLGLSISKAYVEMLGGKIWVESQEGIGSEFYFTLPYNGIKNEGTENIRKPIHTKSIQAKPLNILIADDDASVITYLQVVLNKWAKEVFIAQTGIEAVQICRNNPDIDLILMDIKIPGINGFEATRKIREFNTKVFILVQTAFTQTDYLKKCKTAGCNNYITKPIDKDQLIEIIATHFN